MRFLQPDLCQNDLAGICLRNVPVASVIHFVIVTLHINFPAQGSGLSGVVPAASRYFDTDYPCPSAIQHHLVWQGVAP
jgi:hypothetical protein